MQTPYKLSFYMRIKFKKLFPYYFKSNIFLGGARNSSSLSNISRENFVPFESMVEIRRKEARKSVVVEIEQKENLINLQSICSKFGAIKNMFEFNPSPKKHMCIVEFEEESSLKEMIHRAQMNSNKEILPIHLPFLKILNNNICSQLLPSQIESPLIPVQISKEQSAKDIMNHMRHDCKTISDQIQYFYNSQKMTEVGWRLRFLTCRKIECILPGILSHIKVLPFGSSVNTFGNHNCDLDMIVDFTKGDQAEEKKPFPLIIQPGKEKNSSRGCVQRNLEMMADLMSFYMPGFSQIIKILHANVPIIKCNELFTGLECDITVSNKSGFYMSELLYIYGCSDHRVRPLVFCVRWWAKQKNLTQKMQPGRWFSNFTTTLLVLFFLMNTKLPVIPPVKLLQELSDKSYTLEGITYDFERDVTHLPVSLNEDTLEQLLEEFFGFYSKFDFKKNALSIVTGNAFTKPNYSALYVQNPIEKELNVSKNVNLEELEMFKTQCNFASYSLQEMKITKGNSDDVWGLVALVSKTTDEKRVFNNKLLDFDINEVFEDKMQNEKTNFKEKNRYKETLQNQYGLSRPTMQVSKPKKKRKQNAINKRLTPTFKF